jgi:sodium-coupled monocarboxylate transporter 8/12
VSFYFPQDYFENGSTWKQGAESVIQYGLRQETLSHVPGYDPKNKSYNNMALEKITHL